jgi:hypothetical protein
MGLASPPSPAKPAKLPPHKKEEAEETKKKYWATGHVMPPAHNVGFSKACEASSS